MTITTTTTTIEYMAGFQYTNNSLDFFPHTSTALSAGSEGYAKSLPAVLGGGSSYQFKYVFTYTDHLGNIRLKYVQDPSNNNRISILEEDHYYPYGLKHSGYNSFHQIFATDDGDGPGTGIVLTPVNPFLGDSHKYKFGGMEYQDEFSVNTYDFGARNYDPALGRWMNLDPLAEMMRRHSPYNYAFNNPVYFIDPDGMIPIAVTSLGMGIDGVKDIGGGDEDPIVNSKGKIIADDGKTDGKIYAVKEGVSDKQIQQSIADDNLDYDNLVEYEPNPKTREKMVDIVNKDDGKGGTKDANNREYGGKIRDDQVIESPPGAVGVPGEGVKADITHPDVRKGDVTFHSHASGDIVEGTKATLGGSITTRSWVQTPSPHDIQNATGTEYVFGRGNGTVYIYNSSGVMATIPQKRFVTPKQ